MTDAERLEIKDIIWRVRHEGYDYHMDTQDDTPLIDALVGLYAATDCPCPDGGWGLVEWLHGVTTSALAVRAALTAYRERRGHE